MSMLNILDREECTGNNLDASTYKLIAKGMISRVKNINTQVTVAAASISWETMFRVLFFGIITRNLVISDNISQWWKKSSQNGVL